MKTIVFFVIAAVVVVLALQYSGKRQAELKVQAQMCDEKCKKQGSMGSEFKAGGYGDGECHCL